MKHIETSLSYHQNFFFTRIHFKKSQLKLKKRYSLGSEPSISSPYHWFPMVIPSLSAAAKSLQLCLTLCDPIDGSLPGFPIPGILQARTLKWVAISFSNAWKWKVKVKLLSHFRLCSPPGSSVHGIFQARVLEWGATAFSDLMLTQ